MAFRQFLDWLKKQYNDTTPKGTSADERSVEEIHEMIESDCGSDSKAETDLGDCFNVIKRIIKSDDNVVIIPIFENDEEDHCKCEIF